MEKNQITAGYSHGQTKKCTERALIERVTSQKAPRIKLRELIKKSSQALLDMKPCFIMSPSVLSELVVAQEDFFDLLIIDEASQMRMEDSICALARSKQCVIVGDQQQLPPGNTFELRDSDDDDEEDLIEESILDLANSRFKSNRMLKWHYRSRHHSLIDFSNHHFYQNQLIIPPSPIIKNAIHSNKVEAFYKGKINTQEKDRLITDLIPFMKKNIRKGDTLVEATSGNTGIALALMAKVLGVHMVLVLPENSTVERIKTMRSYGAKVILTPKELGMEGSRDYALKLKYKKGYYRLNQFDNTDNSKAHYKTTGPEIWRDTEGEVTHFIAAMGTTGTVSYTHLTLPTKRIV